MNIEQTDNLCHNTCGMIESMESILDAMKANGLPKYEVAIIDKAIDDILELNKKYVRLREDKENETK